MPSCRTATNIPRRQRRDVLARARQEMPDEIGRGLALLDRLARQHAGVAGLLG